MSEVTHTPLSRPQWKVVWAFLALGVLARVLRLGLNFPLWGDEAYQAANFLPSAPHSALEPLGWGMVAPPVFVALENAVVSLLGFHESSLRLLPTLVGVLGLFVFARIAALVLSGWTRVLAVATFCVSYYPVRHAVEVKPYAFDLFVALLLLWVALEWLRSSSPRRWGWAFALLLPLSLWCSFPAAFVGGGLLLALLPRAIRGEGRAPYIAGGAALLASFAALYHLVIGAQMSHETYLFDLWAHTFPPWREPLELARWFVEMNSGRMMAHPAGGSSGGSALTLLLVIIGVLTLWRSRERLLLGMLLAPFLVNLVAAAMQAYPYGGSARWMLHLAPAICLLFAVGLVCLIRATRTERAGRIVLVVLSLLASLGAFITVRAFVKPYKNLHDLEARDFARRYWRDRGDGAVRLDLATDLGWNLFPTFPEGAPAQYLCNLGIVRGGPPARDAALERLRAGALLRVAFALPRDHELDPEEKAAWLARMEEGFELSAHEVFELPRRRRGEIVRHDRIESYEWRARDPATVTFPNTES